jgi:predicted nucleic acid-binding Zn ribbon protein
MSKPLAHHLRGFLRDSQLDIELHKQKMPMYWAQAVGANMAERSKLIGFEFGVLTVHVPEAAWRYELSLRRNEIKETINSTIGSPMVHTVIVR